MNLKTQFNINDPKRNRERKEAEKKKKEEQSISDLWDNSSGLLYA